MARGLDRVAVMGAGAVGCYYGGILARAGHDVTLIARAQHVERCGGRRRRARDRDLANDIKAKRKANRRG